MKTANASSSYFVWEKSQIDVPIYSNLDDYKDDYILKFYVNGKESFDYTVEMEVNASTFSTVLTNKIGKYTVYYKAYSKKNYISSTEAIIFNVIDITPPNISLVSDVITIDYGKKLSDYNWYSVSDDTCNMNDISITVKEENIIYNNIGTYNSKIIATDIYNNSSEVDFKVKIVNNKEPTILILQPLIFPYGEIIDFANYILCKDNYNNDITSRLVINGLNMKFLGKQEISLSVSDYSNNKTEIILEVLIVDNLPPTIILSEDEVMLDIRNFKEYSGDYFKKYIFSLKDNYSKEEKIGLEINVDELEENISDFIVYFNAFDENNNKTTNTMKVKLREFEGPNIICSDEITISLNEVVDFMSMVSVVDEYDLDAYKRLEIDYGDFDCNKSGVYYIKFTCFNTSGIYSEKTIKVIVEANDLNTTTVEDKLLQIISTQPLVIIFTIVLLFIFLVIGILLLKKNKYLSTRD